MDRLLIDIVFNVFSNVKQNGSQTVQSWRDNTQPPEAECRWQHQQDPVSLAEGQLSQGIAHKKTIFTTGVKKVPKLLA